MSQEHKATVTAEVKGSDKAAKDIGKVAEAEEKLGKQTVQAGKAAEGAAKQTDKLQASEGDQSRAATTTGQNIAKKYEQIGEPAINTVMGLLGDKGLSIEQLVDAAILERVGELGITGDMSPEQRVRTLERVRKAKGEMIAGFRTRETVQGEGLGDASRRPGTTEREGAAGRQAAAVGGSTIDLEALLKDLGLKPGSVSPEEIAQLLKETTLANKEVAESNKQLAKAVEDNNARPPVVHNHNQHSRNMYPDAEAVRRNTINGESDNERRGVG